MMRNLRNKCHVPLCFALWYTLNVAYNITNKWALENVRDFVAENTSQSSALPFTIGCLQFGIGAIYACTLWMLGWRRPVPHAAELSRAASIVANYVRKTCRRTTRLTSLSANSISFAHVVKAMEPIFSALASRLVLGQRMDIRVYLSLIPVVGGVVMACAGSNEFSWISFLSGMSSNAFFAMRGVVSKLVMEGSTKNQSNTSKNIELNEMNNEESKTAHDTEVELSDGDEKEHTHTPLSMSPANLFAAVTCVSFIFSIPIALIVEGGILREIAHISPKAGADKENQNDIHSTILVNIISSGGFHYLNNEVMYLVLSNVHPITLAVGNTMKRVFIIVAGVLVFSTPVTLQTAVGSTIGIGGVLLYGVLKQRYGSASGSDGVICSAKAR
ncbi:hypothetical protein ACHAXR_010393 [Thalassiosira sp. AJA248-18]